MKLQIATWNVRGISHKLEELTKELEERKLDIAIVSETKKKNKGSTDIGSYVMIYSRVPNENWAASGVTLLIRKHLRNRILGYTWISPRIIHVKMRIACREFNIIRVYTPVKGKQEETKIFYTDIQEIIENSTKTEYLILAGDFNARIGNRPVKDCTGSEGEAIINSNGTASIDFCVFNKLKITNAFFRHKRIHKYTWEGRGTQSIIDYIIIGNRLKAYIRDTRVYRGSEIDSNHFLLESEFEIPHKKQRHRNKRRPKTSLDKERLKTHLLEQESIRYLMEKD
jgi:exonuclease III